MDDTYSGHPTKEARNAYMREWNAKNRDKVLANRKASRERQDPEETRAKRKAQHAAMTPAQRANRAETTKRWRAANPDKVAENRRRQHSDGKTLDYRLRSNYGISLAERDAMIVYQLGRCYICGDEFGDKPCVDHCHDSDTVRKILCNNCNVGLGYFKDDPARLMDAAAYAKEHAHLKASRPGENPGQSECSASSE